jgi:hypothetical protein
MTEPIPEYRSNEVTKVCLVAIAKNEGKFLIEWLAHHLSLGFSEILVYDNESMDDTASILRSASKAFPVERVHWKNKLDASPQVSAYRDFLDHRAAAFDWVAFFDLDEFLVVSPETSLISLLHSYPADVAAIGVNWLTFGSSGVQRSDYQLVRETFRQGPPRDFDNNHHIKTIARPRAVERMAIHHCELREGRYAAPSGVELTMSRKKGLSDAIDHTVLQLNHYQVKSREDFQTKIAKGRAGKKIGDPTRIRENAEQLLAKLDKNSCAYDEVDRNKREFEALYAAISAQCSTDSAVKASN